MLALLGLAWVQVKSFAGEIDEVAVLFFANLSTAFSRSPMMWKRSKTIF